VRKVKRGPVTVLANTKNITRLDLVLDERPQGSRDVADGITRFKLSGLPRRAKLLELRGFRRGQLVAGTRVEL
jgi:hypothetical protein